MKKCPYCGRENPDDAVVCQKCCAGFPNEEPKEDESSVTKESRSARRKIRS